MNFNAGPCRSPVKRKTRTIKSVDTARLSELEGKPNFVTLHFHFTIRGSSARGNSPGVSWCVFTAEVKKKKEHRLVRVSLLGHGKLIRGQNTAVENSACNCVYGAVAGCANTNLSGLGLSPPETAMISSPHC